MTHNGFGEWDRGRLRWLLGLFFLALALPTAFLTWQAFGRLEWESFHQHQQLAEELTSRIDRRLVELIGREEARSFADYNFLVVEGAPAANYLQRSPLSAFPVEGDLPGLLGYFQIDAQGRFTTPLLPEEGGVSPQAYGITTAELRQRRELSDRLLHILSREASGDAVEEDGVEAVAGISASAEREGTMPASSPAMTSMDLAADERQRAKLEMKTQAGQEQRLPQALFDLLTQEGAESKRKSVGKGIGRVDELKLEQPAAMAPIQQAPNEAPRLEKRQISRATRKEQIVLPELAEAISPSKKKDHALATDAEPTPAPVRIFESEIDPFEFSRLPGGYFVLYRKVWRDGQRYIQGALLEQAPWLQQLIEAPYRDTVLATMSQLAIAYKGDILSAFGGAGYNRYLASADELAGTLLYRTRLSAPLSDMETVLTITHMPSGPGSALIGWTVLVLSVVLGGGLMLLYRLGLKQIELYRQQRDFVSAVSHELKTPLTSIRMYSEMLREGWADEARKRDYYDFIHDESERLSRLIANVLQLARMSHNGLYLQLRTMGAGQLLDAIHGKIASQVERAGFELNLQCDERAEASAVEVDEDAFIQIVINLVDNAIKFSAKAARRRIEIGCMRLGDGGIRFTVRDYGPGIPRDQLKKIFRLFYRSEDELTRETVGTGIGLALVHRLVTAMGGKVDVVNREPGAEFRLLFPGALRDRPQ